MLHLFCRFPALKSWKKGYRCSYNSTMRESEDQEWTWCSSRMPWYIWWRCPGSSAPPGVTPSLWGWEGRANSPSPSWLPSLLATRRSKSLSQGRYIWAKALSQAYSSKKYWKNITKVQSNWYSWLVLLIFSVCFLILCQWRRWSKEEMVKVIWCKIRKCCIPPVKWYWMTMIGHSMILIVSFTW